MMRAAVYGAAILAMSATAFASPGSGPDLQAPRSGVAIDAIQAPRGEGRPAGDQVSGSQAACDVPMVRSDPEIGPLPVASCGETPRVGIAGPHTLGAAWITEC